MPKINNINGRGSDIRAAVERLAWVLRGEKFTRGEFLGQFNLPIRTGEDWLREFLAQVVIKKTVSHCGRNRPQVYEPCKRIVPVWDMTPCKKHGISQCGICGGGSV